MEASPFAETHFIEDHEEEDTSFGWCCFHGVCWRKSNSTGSKRHLLGEEKDSWLAEKVKKMKEISEVLAGPKWKNFIRSFSMHGFNKNRKMQYQYDFQSYALNFDDGIDKEEVDLVFPNFSARYATSAGMSNQLIEY